MIAMIASIGGTSAFAAENLVNTTAEVEFITPRATVFTDDGWKFKSLRDSNSYDPTGPGRFYANAGQTIILSMTGIYSASSQGFDVYLYQANSSGTPLAGTERGPYHVNANMAGHSLSLLAEKSGYYIIRLSRINDGVQQCIDYIQILVS